MCYHRIRNTHYLVIELNLTGCTVAQLRMIFVPNFDDHCTPRTPFVYVQPFTFSHKSKGVADADVNMYSLVRTYRSNNSRKGLIFPLNRVWRPVELIPKFGKVCDRIWTCDTAVELAKEFYLNCFADKPTYIEVY